MRPIVTEHDILEIYHATLDELYAYVSRRCGGERSLAEDVTQEAWLRAVRSWRRKGLPERPIAWLKTVARNVLLNRMRARARQVVPIETVGAGALVQSLTSDVPGESADRTALVHRALARLAPARARLLERFHFDGCSVAEIAACTGLSERAVEGRLRRARQNLRSEITTMVSSEGGIG